MMRRRLLLATLLGLHAAPALAQPWWGPREERRREYGAWREQEWRRRAEAERRERWREDRERARWEVQRRAELRRDWERRRGAPPPPPPYRY